MALSTSSFIRIRVVFLALEASKTRALGSIDPGRVDGKVVDLFTTTSPRVPARVPF